MSSTTDNVKNILVNRKLINNPITGKDETHIELNWDDPSSSWDGTVIIRKKDNYPLNETDGDLILINNQANLYSATKGANPFIDPDNSSDKPILDNETNYFYGIFPYVLDELSNKIYNINPDNTCSALANITILSSVTELVVSQKNNTQISIQWIDPVSNDWNGTKLIRKIGSYPIDETDGDLIVDEKIRDSYKDAVNAFLDDNNLNLNTIYYYRTFPYDKNGICNLDQQNNETTCNFNFITNDISDLKVTPYKKYLEISWTDPKDSWASTTIIRKIGSEPQNINDGVQIVISTVADPINKFIDNTAFAFRDYYYKPFPLDSVKEFYNNDCKSDHGMLLDDTIPSHVSDLTIKTDSEYVYLQWTDPDDIDWAGTKVIKKVGSYPTNVNDGDLVVDSLVKNQYQGTWFKDSETSPGKKYYYRLFPYDDNKNYNNDEEENETFAIFYKDRIGSVNNLIASTTSNAIILNWSDPSDTNWIGTIILRKIDSYPNDINDGEIIINNTNKDQYKDSPFIDINVVSGKRYFYKLFPYDKNGKYNLSLANNINVLFTDTTPPNNVSNLNSLIIGNNVTFTWQDPNDNDWAGTIIVRKTNTPLKSFNDGEIIKTSILKNQYKLPLPNADTDPNPDPVQYGYTDKNLNDKLVYYYGIFPYDKAGNYYFNDSNIIMIEFNNKLTPGNVQNLVVKCIAPGNIQITYQDPDDMNWLRTRIIRKLETLPINDQDGVEIINSTQKNQYIVKPFLDGLDLIPNKTYNYKAFTYNTKEIVNDNCSLSSNNIELTVKIILTKIDYNDEIVNIDEFWNYPDGDPTPFYIQCSDTTSLIQTLKLKEFIILNDCTGTLSFDYILLKQNAVNAFRIMDNGIEIFKETNIVSDWKTKILNLGSGIHNISFDHLHYTFSTDLTHITKISNINIEIKQ